MFKEGYKAFKIAKGLKKLSTEKDENVRKTVANYLSNLLDNEKGLFLKIGQVIGSKAEALDEFKDLTKSRARAWPLSEIKPFIEKSLNQSVEKIFSTILESNYPASIGQVHEATLKNGDRVAVKVQYPDINEKIASQLDLLNLIPITGKITPMKKWGVNFSDYLNMIKTTIEEELSYKHEIENQKRFQELNKQVSGIKTSKIYENLTSNTVFVQSFEEGNFISEVSKTWTQEEKNYIGEILLSTFFKNLFVDGFIQGDCNIGNYLFRKTNNLPEAVFLDFGNCVEIPEEMRLTLLRLIIATIHEDDIDPLSYMAAIGFDSEKLKHIHESLPILLKIIFDPFLMDYRYDLKSWDLKRKIETTLGEYKWWFRAAGDTVFFKIIKSFFGTVNLLEILDCSLQWKKILYREINFLLPKLSYINPKIISNNVVGFKAMAKHLTVQVFENNREKVFLTLPSSSLLNIEDLLEEDILKKLEDRHLSIKEIAGNALKQGAPPQQLFELEEGPKKYIVSLS